MAASHARETLGRRRLAPSLATFLPNAGAVRAVLLAYLSTRLMIFFIIFVSMATLPVRPGVDRFNYASPGDVILDGLVRWDSWQFLDIAAHGYKVGNSAARQIGSVSSFPVYPGLIKLVAPFIGNIFVTGVLISNVALLVALGYLYALARHEFDDESAARAVFYYAAAPASVFFSAIYSESLFVAFAIASFYYAVKQRWVYAAVVGALAAATRNTGILRVAVIALEGLHQRGVRFGPLLLGRTGLVDHLRQQGMLALRAWCSLLAAAFASIGLLAYMAYLAAKFGDPLAFYHDQAYFGRDASGAQPLKLLVNLYRELQIGPSFWNGQVNTGFLLDTLSLAAFVVLVIVVARTLRLSYAVYAVLTLITPLTTNTAFSMTRYSLMIFPCYIVLARWGRRSWADRLIVGILFALMAYIAVTFSHYYAPI